MARADDPLAPRSAPPRRPCSFKKGTVANQGRFYSRFDAIVLLSAPIEVIFDRLHTRTDNPHPGKTQAERRQIADDIANVEPLLRQAATHEIDTNRPLSEVVDMLMNIAQSPERAEQAISGDTLIRPYE